MTYSFTARIGLAAGIALSVGSVALAVGPGLFSSITPELSVSTLGIGPEIDSRFAVAPFGVRAGANFFSITHDVKSRDATYSGKADLINGGAILDWYPFLAGFRLSAGVKGNGNSIDITPKANGTGAITLNNAVYTTAGSNVTGKISFNQIAPYAGIGFASPVSGPFTIGLDAGVMFEGTPKVAMQASGPILGQANFVTNFSAEKNLLLSKVKAYKYYPVAELSFGWRF